MLGSDSSEETWRALDERVNTYPTKRAFKGEPGQASFKVCAMKVTSQEGPAPDVTHASS